MDILVDRMDQLNFIRMIVHTSFDEDPGKQ